MDIELAYVRLHHLATMLNKGQVSSLHLDQECERLQYADAAFSVLPVLEKFGVKVDKQALEVDHSPN